jgi:hypothetical protein
MSSRVRLFVAFALAAGLLATSQASDAALIGRTTAEIHHPATTMLRKVSCAANDDCLAIGWHSWRNVGISLAEWWDGDTWSRVQALAWTTTLNDVSCVGEGWCMVVGSTRGPHGGQLTYSETFLDRHPSVVPTPAVRLAQFEAVACSSVNSCYAVGSYQPRNEYVRPLVERWDGARWTFVRSPYLHDHFLEAISCGAGETCMASGYQSLEGRPFAERLTGGSWIVTPVPTFSVPQKSCRGGFPCPPLTPQVLAEDSCGASRCVAVSDFEEPVIWSWTKKGWTLEADPSTAMQFISAACWSASTCLLLGARTGSRATVVDELAGGRWKAERGFGATLIDVSCTSSSRCMAVGYETWQVDHGTTKSVAAEWNGHAWRSLLVLR